MSSTPTNLSAAALASRDVSFNAAPVRGAQRLLAGLSRLANKAGAGAATLAAGLFLATAAHAVPQVSSLVHAPDILPAGCRSRRW
jgi:hypothetical protein